MQEKSEQHTWDCSSAGNGDSLEIHSNMDVFLNVNGVPYRFNCINVNIKKTDRLSSLLSLVDVPPPLRPKDCISLR